MSEYRAESMERWHQVADGWKETREAFQRTAMPISRWMIDAIDPRPGQTVLELAAGLGDTGLLAAELVAPSGKVIITDAAEGMVRNAQERALEVGATNVEVRQMEAEWIDLGAATVDGVLCRFGYMLLADPEAAMRETRRVLRPGGRVALAVWDVFERNPWMAVLRRELVERGLMEPPPPGSPGPTALAEPSAIEALLDATGFDDPVVDTVDVVFEASSLDAWWEHAAKTSPGTAQALRGASPADHYRLREAVDAGYAPYVADDGSVAIPGRALVAAATA
jgi:SAM-dependent methyltransferase